MPELVEVQMARLQEQMKQVIDGMEHSRRLHEKSDERSDRMEQTIDRIDRRLNDVEKQLATNAPTIEEFITIKHQVKGAGILGRWIWAAGGFLIAFVFSMRAQIRDFFF